MSRFIPFYISGRYEPGRRIAFIPDWEEKIKKAVERTKDKDIRLIAGIPSWLLVLFDQLLTAKKREKICEVWPGISLLIYGGLNFSPYQKLMEDIIGKDIYYMETYFASEALMGIQDTPYPPGQTDGNGLLLMLDYGVFYEFVKAEDITKANPRRYTAADIEEDVSYAIIITNTSGLYSYIIGDTVRFVSKRPLRVRVTGRLEDFLSTLGEHLIAEEVEYTMSQASLRTGALVKNFTVAPYFPKEKTHRPGHQWLVEFSKPPDSTDKFMKTIDEALCLKNDDYKAHRKGSFGMSMPILYELKEGTFYQWHKLKGTLGGQHKTPRLKNDRVMAEELIELSED